MLVGLFEITWCYLPPKQHGFDVCGVPRRNLRKCGVSWELEVFLFWKCVKNCREKCFPGTHFNLKIYVSFLSEKSSANGNDKRRNLSLNDMCSCITMNLHISVIQRGCTGKIQQF